MVWKCLIVEAEELRGTLGGLCEISTILEFSDYLPDEKLKENTRALLQLQLVDLIAYVATLIGVNTRSSWSTALGLLTSLHSPKHLVCHSLKIFELTVRKKKKSILSG